MKLRSVYDYPEDTRLDVLYELLAERTPAQSISHREMPTLTQHKRFVESQPYAEWWFIVSHHDYTNIFGCIYVTVEREIGISVFNQWQGQGIGTEAMEILLRTHPGKFLANIAPGNQDSIDFFAKHGFTHIQNTLMRK